MDNKKYQSLWEVLDMIKDAFDDFISYQTFLVEAEVNKINKYNQFYYIDLVEIKNWKILEMAKSNIFNPNIMTDFLSETNIQTSHELVWKKILLTLRPSFHKRYWFSFNILKIHSDYFLWTLEKSKKENIDKLQKLWIFENNKELSIWYPNFKIAVITWKHSEWFRDFDTIIKESGYNIKYDVFTSLVHWEKASKEVLETLKNIDTSKYNLITIIRGWGWSEWMNWTNDFELNKYICELDKPVMSAVWHTIDRNIIDMISRYDCKTPSEAASILIWIYENYENDLIRYSESINKSIKTVIKEYSIEIWHIYNNIKTSIKWRLKNYQIKIDSFDIIYEQIKSHLKNIKTKLNSFESIIRNNNPSNVISKWYNLIYDTKWELQTEYNIWESYLMSSKSYNYKINILDKKDK